MQPNVGIGHVDGTLSFDDQAIGVRGGAAGRPDAMAVELHDRVAPLLLRARLLLEEAAASGSSEPAVVPAAELAAAAMQELRQVMAGAPEPLRPLSDHIADLTNQVAASAGMVTTWCWQGPEVVVGPDATRELGAILEELVRNVVRHAHAHRLHVLVQAGPTGIQQLVVRDDGRGFDPSTVAPDRVGLRGVRQRADRLGATLVFDTEAGRGTQISVVLPRRTARALTEWIGG